jgi:hypothetical protein
VSVRQTDMSQIKKKKKKKKNFTTERKKKKKKKIYTCGNELSERYKKSFSERRILDLTQHMNLICYKIKDTERGHDGPRFSITHVMLKRCSAPKVQSSFIRPFKGYKFIRVQTETENFKPV